MNQNKELVEWLLKQAESHEQSVAANAPEVAAHMAWLRAQADRLAKPPSVYFITAFSDAYMEMARAFMGQTPSAPFTETYEDGKARIARVRDDGTKLYHLGSGPLGHWTRLGGDFYDSEADAAKELQHIERCIGKHRYYSLGGSRTFGFYFSKEEALAAVTRNAGDMHELLYTWIVVEPYRSYGVHPGTGEFTEENDPTIWFKWGKNQVGATSNSIAYQGSWVRAERPPETKQIICFAL